MENKITQKTEAPTLILAQRLKKIKQRLTNCKSIEEEDITEIELDNLYAGKSRTIFG